MIGDQTMLREAAQLFLSGERERAKIICYRILADDPANSLALSILGMVFGHSGDFATAVPLLERANHLLPGFSDIHRNLVVVLNQLAISLHIQGQEQDAIACYKRSSELRNVEFNPGFRVYPEMWMNSTSGPILLTCPKSGFYEGLLKSFSFGFYKLGFECFFTSDQANRVALHEWVKKHRPKFVLEINYVLNCSENWPQGVLHALWLQDYRTGYSNYGVLSDLGVSDIIYFVVPPHVFGLPIPPSQKWAVLLPGARDDVPDRPEGRVLRDFSITGYIPNPPDGTMTVAQRHDGTVVSLDEFLKYYPDRFLHHSELSINGIKDAVTDTCNHLKCTLLNSDLRLFEDTLPRSFDRIQTVRSLENVSNSIDIFGSPNWMNWSHFNMYYRKYLANQCEVDDVYQTSHINIHNGIVSMHFRVLDCMAAGGFILVNETPLDFDIGGIRTFFEPGRHYGSYTFDTLAEIARSYLEDIDLCRRIGQEARKRVLEQHTWRHRAQQVVNDLGFL